MWREWTIQPEEERWGDGTGGVGSGGEMPWRTQMMDGLTNVLIQDDWSLSTPSADAVTRGQAACYIFSSSARSTSLVRRWMLLVQAQDVDVDDRLIFAGSLVTANP